MAIRVSRASLASAVANCGGIGVIAASGLEEEELRNQIREARANITKPGGLLAINIMFVASEFNMIIKTAIEEKIDLIIFGAGFSRDIFTIGKEAGVPIIPIVSSAKLAVLAKKLGAAAVIVESGEAGGHLGTCKSIRELIPEIKEAMDKIPDNADVGKVSIIAAAGITNGADIMEILSMGADGVQRATRFLLSKECDVHENFKQLLLNAKQEDIVLIQSPVGLPARAILTEFSKKILDGSDITPRSCKNCMKHCVRNFCIIKALEAARLGDVKNGLFFTGENLKKYTTILSVEEIFANLEKEAAKWLEMNAPTPASVMS